MVELVRGRYGNLGVMIGDRPSTDGAFAAALGWPFALVLSGVAGSAGEEPVPDPPPPFVAADLGPRPADRCPSVASGTLATATSRRGLRCRPGSKRQMPPTPDWKRALETGMQFTEVRRSQAREIAPTSWPRVSSPATRCRAQSTSWSR